MGSSERQKGQEHMDEWRNGMKKERGREHQLIAFRTCVGLLHVHMTFEIFCLYNVETFALLLADSTWQSKIWKYRNCFLGSLYIVFPSTC